MSSLLQSVFSAKVNSFFYATVLTLKGEFAILPLWHPLPTPVLWPASWTCLVAPRALVARPMQRSPFRITVLVMLKLPFLSYLDVPHLNATTSPAIF